MKLRDLVICCCVRLYSNSKLDFFFFHLAVLAKMNRQRVGMSNALERQITLLLYRAWVLKGMLGGNDVPVGTFYTCLPVMEKSIV